MKRFAAGVDYGGEAYAGWQAQPHAPSVQVAVEAALSRVADHSLRVVAAGRTDAGVHAVNQVIHFDSAAERPGHGWLFGTNTGLPPEISLRWVREVPGDFHARFSAVARRYRYVILNHRARSGRLAGRVTWERTPLHEGAMADAARCWLGTHDFTSLRSAECQSRSPSRTVHAVHVRRDGDLVLLDVRANAFLHHMVRNMAGVLLAIGRGERTVQWATEVLEARDRRRAGVTAPACGLYFCGPEYPDDLRLPPPEPPTFLS